MNFANIYTVTSLNKAVRQLLEAHFQYVWLRGEISNFSQPASGHWYFTLKDSAAQIRCAMFRGRNSQVKFNVKHGMEVLVRAKLSLYEPRGDYQLIVDSMRLSGEGALELQFIKLKEKLAAAGFFNQANKKQLPAKIKKVGVVTSKSGAALLDIIEILNRRDPSIEIVIYPVAVQGMQAAGQIIKAIEIANLRNEVDILIVGRGGGSLEDLWCFNDELLAKTVFASKLPVISAVGHETDITIIDLVADLRAPTPSAGAELVSFDQRELVKELKYLQLQLEHAMANRWQQLQQELDLLVLNLHKNEPQQLLVSQRAIYMQLNLRLKQAMLRQLELHRTQLATYSAKLNTASPLATLARGYSIVTNLNGNVVTRAAQTQKGELLEVQLSQGSIKAEVL